MKKLITLGLVAAFTLSIAVSAFAVEDHRRSLLDRFNIREKNLIAALTADPAESRAFFNDAALVKRDPSQLQDVLALWRGKGLAFASRYLRTTHATNRNATKLRDMIEPSEWAYTMALLRNMDSGFMKDTLISWIQESNEKLAKGDNSKALDTIETARGKFTDEFEEYTQSDGASAILTAYNRVKQRRAAQTRSRDEDAEVRRTEEARQERERRQEGALEQARRAAEQGNIARDAQDEGEAREAAGRTFTGEDDKNREVIVPVVGTAPEAGQTRPTLTLNPPDTVAGANLGGDEPPPPMFDGEGEDLESMKSGTGGLDTLKFAAKGAGIGAILGLLLGILGGPIGIVAGALIGAVVGGAGAYIYKRFFGGDSKKDPEPEPSPA